MEIIIGVIALSIPACFIWFIIDFSRTKYYVEYSPGYTYWRYIVWETKSGVPRIVKTFNDEQSAIDLCKELRANPAKRIA